MKLPLVPLPLSTCGVRVAAAVGRRPLPRIMHRSQVSNSTWTCEFWAPSAVFHSVRRLRVQCLDSPSCQGTTYFHQIAEQDYIIEGQAR
ncbi:hypothetical protein B0H19DRAFT_523820 [Mycena capillaripes]|nr:hypothetical protein B0H19DRAFT_523820 [Mycena capillaripes]